MIRSGATADMSTTPSVTGYRYRDHRVAHAAHDRVHRRICDTVDGGGEKVGPGPTQVRFELTRGNPNGLAVHRLNHSATASRNQSSSSRLLFPITKYYLCNVGGGGSGDDDNRDEPIIQVHLMPCAYLGYSTTAVICYTYAPTSPSDWRAGNIIDCRRR